MPAKYKASLLFFLCADLPCFAGGLKGGPFISDAMIYAFIGYLVFVHGLGIVTFVLRKLWLRIVAGILYLPVFLVVVGLFFISPIIGIAGLLFAMAFLIFLIIWPRK